MLIASAVNVLINAKTNKQTKTTTTHIKVNVCLANLSSLRGGAIGLFTGRIGLLGLEEESLPPDEGGGHCFCTLLGLEASVA